MAVFGVARANDCTIREFGGPYRMMSPMSSVHDMQVGMRAHEQEIRKALKDAAWPGDPQDFFNAVEAGRLEDKSYPVGQEFKWMALRMNGRVTVAEQKCYGGA